MGKTTKFKWHSNYFETVEFEWRVELKCVLSEVLKLKTITSPVFGCGDGQFNIELYCWESSTCVDVRQQHPSEAMLVVVRLEIKSFDGESYVLGPDFSFLDQMHGRGWFGEWLDTIPSYPHFTVAAKIDYCLAKYFGDESNMTVLKCHRLSHENKVERPSNLSLLEKSIFTDCVIKVGDKEILAHKCLLAQHSDVFRAMFCQDAFIENESSEIIIEDFEYNTVKGMVEFVYGGITKKVDLDLNACMMIADKYCIERLKEYCGIKLAVGLGVENIFKTFAVADAANSKPLLEECGIFLLKHRRLLQSKAWEEFRQESDANVINMCRYLMDTFAKTLNLRAGYEEAL